MIFENFYLFFFSETHDSVVETDVRKLCISSKVWTRLENITGPAEQIIFFRNDENFYILQTNGSLWSILNVHSIKYIELKFVLKFWNVQKKLYGVLTYNGKLVMFGNDRSKDPPGLASTVPGHIEEIKYLGSDAKCFNFIPITLLKSCLRQYNKK